MTTTPRSAFSDVECPGTSTPNTQLVIKFMTEFWAEKDETAIDRYMSEDFINQNPRSRNKDDVKGVMRAMKDTLTYEASGVFGNCDLVFAYGKFTGLGPKPQVVADIFRIRDGLIVEHWDILQELVPINETAGGVAMYTERLFL